MNLRPDFFNQLKWQRSEIPSLDLFRLPESVCNKHRISFCGGRRAESEHWQQELPFSIDY